MSEAASRVEEVVERRLHELSAPSPPPQSTHKSIDIKHMHPDPPRSRKVGVGRDKVVAHNLARIANDLSSKS